MAGYQVRGTVIRGAGVDSSRTIDPPPKKEKGKREKKNGNSAALNPKGRNR